MNILGADQHVWVFTDNTRVVYRLGTNRETEFLALLLSSFKGTAVTDFYGGYDALPCRQKKCLVHLIRDLNDDLWKNPFDEEFERFVVAVRNLLLPIVEDVQRFGLKARHLRKHCSRVDRFYRETITGKVSAGTRRRDIGRGLSGTKTPYSASLTMTVFLGTTTPPREHFVTWQSNGRSRVRSARKEPPTTSVCLLSLKPAASRASPFSDSSCRKLQTSTNTKNGAECIPTGPSTHGKRNNPHTPTRSGF